MHFASTQIRSEYAEAQFHSRVWIEFAHRSQDEGRPWTWNNLNDAQVDAYAIVCNWIIVYHYHFKVTLVWSTDKLSQNTSRDTVRVVPTVFDELLQQGIITDSDDKTHACPETRKYNTRKIYISDMKYGAILQSSSMKEKGTLPVGLRYL